MASESAVGRTLAFLHELYPTREITPEAVAAWTVAFRDWDDRQLMECAMKAAREVGRTFFPTPGEITALRPRPALDLAGILHRISELGQYNPHTGWQYPRIDVVREALGDAIATAYGSAGAERCFADDANDGSHVTRDIARREFEKNLEMWQTQNPDRPLLPAPQQNLLTEG